MRIHAECELNAYQVQNKNLAKIKVQKKKNTNAKHVKSNQTRNEYGTECMTVSLQCVYQFAIQIAGLKKKRTNGKQKESHNITKECVCKVKLNKRIQRVEKKLFIIRESLTQNAKKKKWE